MVNCVYVVLKEKKVLYYFKGQYSLISSTHRKEIKPYKNWNKCLQTNMLFKHYFTWYIHFLSHPHITQQMAIEFKHLKGKSKLNVAVGFT